MRAVWLSNEIVTSTARGLGDTMADFAGDVRHAARQMRRRPAFSAIVILALGLGIGATVSLYSVVNDLLVRSLPYDGEERIHVFWMDDNWRGVEYDFVRERRGIFDDVAAFSTNSAPYHPSASASGSAAACFHFTVSTGVAVRCVGDPAPPRPGLQRRRRSSWRRARRGHQLRFVATRPGRGSARRRPIGAHRRR